jgi:hypothetical protein
MFPKSGAPMETDAHSRALLNISFGVPNKGTLGWLVLFGMCEEIETLLGRRFYLLLSLDMEGLTI